MQGPGDPDSSQSNDWQSTRSTVNAIVFSSDSAILHQILSRSFSANSTDSRESAILDSGSHRTASQSSMARLPRAKQSSTS